MIAAVDIWEFFPFKIVSKGAIKYGKVNRGKIPIRGIYSGRLAGV
jgi:hypothetical protein